MYAVMSTKWFEKDFIPNLNESSIAFDNYMLTRKLFSLIDTNAKPKAYEIAGKWSQDIMITHTSLPV